MPLSRSKSKATSVGQVSSGIRNETGSEASDGMGTTRLPFMSAMVKFSTARRVLFIETASWVSLVMALISKYPTLMTMSGASLLLEAE